MDREGVLLAASGARTRCGAAFADPHGAPGCSGWAARGRPAGVTDAKERQIARACGPVRQRAPRCGQGDLACYAVGERPAVWTRASASRAGGGADRGSVHGHARACARVRSGSHSSIAIMASQCEQKLNAAGHLCVVQMRPSEAAALRGDRARSRGACSRPAAGPTKPSSGGHAWYLVPGRLARVGDAAVDSGCVTPEPCRARGGAG